MSQLAEDRGAITGDIRYSRTFQNRIYQVLAIFHFNGVRGGFSHCFHRLMEFLVKKPGKHAPQEQATFEEPFAAGSSYIRFEGLAVHSPSAKWGLPYEPSRKEMFHKAVRSLPIRVDEYCFIDLGAGKGHALVLAMEYPFKRILGVEYSKTLTDAASVNIRSYSERAGLQSHAECIWGDAAEFELPNEPTILYLYNPFQGRVMDRVVENIERSLQTAPRELWVIYGNPWEGRKFRRSPMLQTVEWNKEYSLHRSIHRPTT